MKWQETKAIRKKEGPVVWSALGYYEIVFATPEVPFFLPVAGLVPNHRVLL
jgi:hypothetical protein